MQTQEANNVFEKIDGEFTYPSIYTDMVKRFPSGSTFVEVGSYKGKSLAFLILESMRRNKEFNITAIDNFVGCEGCVDTNLINTFVFNMNALSDKFQLFVGISWDAAQHFQDKSVDFVFIDAAHDYASVIKDIRAWLPKIKKGGIIAGHDYKTAVNIDVSLAVHEVFGKNIIKDYTKEYCWAYEVNT